MAFLIVLVSIVIAFFVLGYLVNFIVWSINKWLYAPETKKQKNKEKAAEKNKNKQFYKEILQNANLSTETVNDILEKMK